MEKQTVSGAAVKGGAKVGGAKVAKVKKVRKPKDPNAPRRFAQRVKFTDPLGTLLDLQARESKDGTFRVGASETKKGSKKVRLGVETFATKDKALAKFNEHSEMARANGWVATKAKGAGKAERAIVIPKAGVGSETAATV